MLLPWCQVSPVRQVADAFIQCHFHRVECSAQGSLSRGSRVALWFSASCLRYQLLLPGSLEYPFPLSGEYEPGASCVEVSSWHLVWPGVWDFCCGKQKPSLEGQHGHLDKRDTPSCAFIIMPVEVDIGEQLSVQSSQRNKTITNSNESLTYKRVWKGLLCGETVILVYSVLCCLFPFLQVSEGPVTQ